jgi:hypothetical protein
MTINLSEQEIIRIRGWAHKAIMSQKQNEYTDDDILVLKLDEVLGVSNE